VIVLLLAVIAAFLAGWQGRRVYSRWIVRRGFMHLTPRGREVLEATRPAAP
jgi:hypothetical protein